MVRIPGPDAMRVLRNEIGITGHYCKIMYLQPVRVQIVVPRPAYPPGIVQYQHISFLFIKVLCNKQRGEPAKIFTMDLFLRSNGVTVCPGILTPQTGLDACMLYRLFK